MLHMLHHCQRTTWYNSACA